MDRAGGLHATHILALGMPLAISWSLCSAAGIAHGTWGKLLRLLFSLLAAPAGVITSAEW